MFVAPIHNRNNYRRLLMLAYNPRVYLYILHGHAFGGHQKTVARDGALMTGPASTIWAPNGLIQ